MSANTGDYSDSTGGQMISDGCYAALLLPPPTHLNTSDLSDYKINRRITRIRHNPNL